MLEEKWRVDVLDGLTLHMGDQVIHRFRTQKTGELLAFLAVYLGKPVLREELVDRIWTDSTWEAGRASLRTALNSLRGQLEPPGVLAKTVLFTDRSSVWLVPEAVTTDIEAFDAAVRQEEAGAESQQLALALAAIELYRGPLLPGCYSDWVIPERDRLGQTYAVLLRRIIELCSKNGDFDRALDYARRLIGADPLCEDSHMMTMQLLAASGRPAEAMRCYQNWKRLLFAELAESPSPAAASLAQSIVEAEGGNVAGARTGVSPSAASSLPQLDDSPTIEEMRIRPPSHSPPADRAIVRLPVMLNRFFGRETEIMEVLQKLLPETVLNSQQLSAAAACLVTLTGPGGAGKTRLAIEIGRRLANESGHSVIFVPLAEVSEPLRILDSIAFALSLKPTPEVDLSIHIAAALAMRPHLLILDNLEQLLHSLSGDSSNGIEIGTSAAEVIYDLLSRTASLSCLVTSRQCLEIEGESEYPVLPLATPAYSGTPERLLEFVSVQLFVDRSQAARPDFQLTGRNSESVAALCTRLDGLPLALELAASWSSVLSPSQILANLETRFDRLASRGRGRLSRHQTLWAAIEWSYNLLTPQLQSFFAKLAIFRLGWTVEAAEAICEQPDVLECLRSLRDRSMLTVEEIGGDESESMRFRLLETLREFAAEHISVLERDELRRRHLKWYADWAERMRPGLMGSDQAACLRRVASEQENVRAALDWSLGNDEDVGDGLRLFACLFQFWCLQGIHGEVQSLLTRLLAHSEDQSSSVWRAHCLRLGGTLAYHQQDWTAAERYFEECQDSALDLNDVPLIAVSRLSLGDIAANRGDFATALKHYEDAQQEYRGIGHVLGIAAMYGAFGTLAMRQGDLQSAVPNFLHAVELHKHEGNLSGVTYHLMELAIVYASLGEHDLSRDCLAESLDGYWSLGDLRGLAELLHNLVSILPVSDSSVRLLAASQALNASVAASPFCENNDRDLILTSRAALGDTVFETAWSEGYLLSAEHAVAEARSILAGAQRFRPILTFRG